jgi:hypothetical protein
VQRDGIDGRRLRRLHRPAPGWEYDVRSANGRWSYHVRYDRSGHERPRRGELA